MILPLICMVVLPGCTSGLVIGGAVIAANSIKDPRSIGTQIDDKILETYISNALSKNKDIKETTRITNTVYQGKVLLTGQAPNKKLAEQATQISSKIKGSKKIYNEIRQAYPIPLEKIIIDLWITTKIKIQIFIKNKTILSSIKIVTENKEVFLLGEITHQEEKTLINTIDNIHGIRNIITAFNYVS
ncbi:division/outer membrane stress-associated lipid-binding lipoprotein [Blochmannia endosymbiont of Colobopsis nipponica]|uniref:division/outer membrane stress-associated lipid-binding lipoprotein n=1 Tax=Blochmannia endosymbiont of Colobopsis nipponica TaxID=2681987 RepID=UPI001CE3214A|nr:division/outer membrane stress-associated lipid-binding lipoprotein [Blochmannia endosymbiont of Colobopsis nipponica]